MGHTGREITDGGKPLCLAQVRFNFFLFPEAINHSIERIAENKNLQRGAVYRNIDTVQGRLGDGLREICSRRGIPALIQGPRGVFFFFFTEKTVLHSWRDVAALDWERQARFLFKLAEAGVLLMFYGRWYISAALTTTDVDRVLEATDRVLAKL